MSDETVTRAYAARPRKVEPTPAASGKPQRTPDYGDPLTGKGPSNWPRYTEWLLGPPQSPSPDPAAFSYLPPPGQEISYLDPAEQEYYDALMRENRIRLGLDPETGEPLESPRTGDVGGGSPHGAKLEPKERVRVGGGFPWVATALAIARAQAVATAKRERDAEEERRKIAEGLANQTRTVAKPKPVPERDEQHMDPPSPPPKDSTPREARVAVDVAPAPLPCDEYLAHDADFLTARGMSCKNNVDRGARRFEPLDPAEAQCLVDALEEFAEGVLAHLEDAAPHLGEESLLTKDVVAAAAMIDRRMRELENPEPVIWDPKRSRHPHEGFKEELASLRPGRARLGAYLRTRELQEAQRQAIVKEAAGEIPELRDRISRLAGLRNLEPWRRDPQGCRTYYCAARNRILLAVESLDRARDGLRVLDNNMIAAVRDHDWRLSKDRELEVASAVLNLVPFLGSLKTLIEGHWGRDMFTDKPLSWDDREGRAFWGAAGVTWDVGLAAAPGMLGAGRQGGAAVKSGIKPTGPESASLRELFLRHSDDQQFRKLADAYVKRRGYEPIDWPAFRTWLEKSEYRDFKSIWQARGVGSASPKGEAGLFGLARLTRGSKEAVRHELLHGIQFQHMGILENQPFFRRQALEIGTHRAASPKIFATGLSIALLPPTMAVYYAAKD